MPDLNIIIIAEIIATIAMMLLLGLIGTVWVMRHRPHPDEEVIHKETE